MFQLRPHRRFSAPFLLVVALGLATPGRAAEPAPQPDSIPALQQAIEGILQRRGTHAPGVAIAIVRRDGPEWIAGLGVADVATKKPVTPDTLFRIGSTSKAFVALALLKLQQEGKLRLEDTLKSHAPDLEFTNPWEATDPVRLVHLLEHTAGWDDMALREYAFDPPEECTLREGLALRPETRTSRWKPGTRFSYSNMGPGAAAYVVEKTTGQRFEDYVAENWFRPLGMKTANYLGTPEVLRQLTQLYRNDGRTPYPYWKISVRPAGSINASARDMANYVQFYLNRGAFDGVQLLPSSLIDRMEHPMSTYAAREGLTAGYGLHIGASIRDGWVYFGHNGGVMGGLTEFAYLPDLGVGYCFMINSSTGRDFDAISRAIRGYLTRSATPPAKPPAVTVPATLAHDYNGWYEPINPRNELARFTERLARLTKFKLGETSLTSQGLGGGRSTFVATGERTFRRERDPLPTVALIRDRSEGTLIQMGGATFRRLPPGMASLQIMLGLATVMLGAGTLGFALVWVPRRLWGGLRGAPHVRVRALPLFTTLAGVVLFITAAASFGEAIERLGRPTPWAIAIFILSLVFPLLAFWGLVVVWRSRKMPIRRLVWWHSFATALALSVVAAYLAYWGIVGVRTWA